jgi:aerobic-type carbon monoxide dehydrogenase small subunit (CoxS/CutS family)
MTMTSASEARRVSMTVNGEPRAADAEPRLTLVDFLRHRLHLTGTHVGCEHGVCGACTVLVDGLAVRSCLMLAVQAEGRRVETVESLAASGPLHPLQRAFSEHHALQCGYCTPGILMTLSEFLRDVPDPTEEELRKAISGNLCRCTGYHNIIKAAVAAAAELRARPGQ